ncbi:hypothetical protein Q8F55_006834 [Vanrija albida]|uniref:Zn(2)-C6 fungal-type domain-containing protein n=1 Tax=Vanrija albida TaxID=181172 RepID=A0ABR3PYJ5_9TREE
MDSDPSSTASQGPSKPKVNWKNGPPSCKECVRLKLKCSRSWPCTSCVRRGCEKICPLGTLPGRQPKAQATILQLQKENRELKARLAHLEGKPLGASEQTSPSSDRHESDAGPSRASLQSGGIGEYTPFSAVSPEPEHGLPNNIDARDDTMLDTTAVPGSGIMESGRDGTKYLGRGAGTLFVIEDDEPTPSSLVFPFMSSDRAALANVHELFPTVDEAYKLLDVYEREVEWMYRPLDRLAAREALQLIYSGGSISERIHHVPPHRLATVLMVFALAITFTNGPMSQSMPFFNAASALLCVPERHFMVRHTLSSVETLHMMVSYLLTLGNALSAKAAWPLIGLCVRIACAIGLHRDPSSWGLSAKQEEDRARLWWECVTYDMFLGLNYGRPYAIPAQLINVPPPPYPADGGVTPSEGVFHAFKYRLAQSFFRIADYLGSSELPDYSVVVTLDSELRRVEAQAPNWLKWSDFYDPATMKLSPTYITQQHSATMFYHKGLLVLHRPWFFKAVQGGSEPLLGPYAASFTTCVTSARKHTRLMASLLRCCPQAAYGWWYFIFHAFTAAIIQYTVLRRVPQSMMADEVRADFDASFDIIKQMSEHSGTARRALPVLARLHDRLKDSAGPTPTSASGGDIGDRALYEMFLGSAAPDPAAASDMSQELSWGQQMDPNGVSMYNPPTQGYDTTSMMLGFEQPAFQPTNQDQMSITDPLIQTLLYWNAIANPEAPQGIPVPQV